MSKKVILVGHCGADTAYLKLAVKAADPTAAIVSAESDNELKAQLDSGAELVLINRLVDYGFTSDMGVDLIRGLSRFYPASKFMLISNHEDAQEASVQAGGAMGFGKREIGTPKVKSLLQSVLTAPAMAK